MLGRATLTLPASPSAMVLADTVAVGFAQEAGIAVMARSRVFPSTAVLATLARAMARHLRKASVQVAGGSALLAAASWRWFEKPVLRWKARFE
jgi:hypothetical protein